MDHNGKPTTRPIGHRPRGSSVSRVSIEHFDPAGVRSLQRTYSSPANPQSPGRAESHDSEATVDVDGEFDFEKVLRRVVQWRGEANIRSRELGVMFQDLRVQGTGATQSYIPSLISMFSPATLVETVREMIHPTVRDLLQGFEGTVRPGEMTLVLGRPGSGCTTLLKTLTNNRAEYHAVHGDVWYGSLSPAEIEKSYRGELSYCPEDDVHFPMMSVSQTLEFAAKTRAPRTRLIDPQTQQRHSREHFVDGIKTVLSTIFGLGHVLDTPVGDAAIRGVSGGQKKRVSIAEALATRARLTAWDNSTRGLDASTALEFVRALRIATDVDDLACIVSIYQAGESLYNLFDKIILVYDGRMVYHGPADRARQYFIDMGFAAPARQTTADFLVSVTDPVGRVIRNDHDPNRAVPSTAAEFAEYFSKSQLGEQNRLDLEAFRTQYVSPSHSQAAEDREVGLKEYKESVYAERARGTRHGSPYTLSIAMQLRAVMLRRVQILKGNPTPIIVSLVSFVVQAVITGSIFVQISTSTEAYFSRGGVLFFALLFASLNALAEIATLYSQRPIVLRHMRSALYHPWVDSFALTLVDIPIAFVTMALFCVTLYWIVGLQASAGQFFIFFLFIFVMTLTMKSWFRAIAAAFASEATAQALAGLSVLPIVIYTGYTIPPTSMHAGLKWITYINPLRYGFEAVLTNEFHTINGQCSNLVPQGLGYEGIDLANQVCTTVGSIPGQATVNGDRFTQLSYGFDYENLWMNFGIVIAFWFGFTVLYFILTEINAGSAAEISVPSFKRGFRRRSDKETADEQLKAQTADAALDAVPTSTDIFSWQHLHYSVPIHGEADRLLLDDVSGYVAPGKLTALMGESGAGKTTLLNVLAERAGTGVVTGDRFVNGQLPHDLGALTGYVQQTDTHLPTATVREALLFSAKLRQPSSVPLSEKEDYVEQCLVMCGLVDYADASVGTLGIEMRKRTTIGVELAAKPRLLLFLDEPTSGLDSQSSARIMAFLRQLASSGQAILCTIHQPSGELFEEFDRLLLLKKGGKTVFFGDIGKNSETLVNYFQRQGGRTCEPHENVAEWMLEVIGAGATATTKFDWNELWRKSAEATRLQEDLERIHSEGRARGTVESKAGSEFATPWLYQTKELTIRAFVRNWRDTSYLMAKLLLNVFGGLFIGLTFLDSDSSQQGTQNKLFAIFLSTVLAVSQSNQLQVVYVNVRSIYLIRERPSNMYSWSALVTSQILSEIPLNIVGSSLYFICWYFLVGFPLERGGYTYAMLGLLFPIYFTTIGMAVASIVPTAELAALLFTFLFSFVLNFNGVMQPYSQLGFWKWMWFVSPFTYLIGGMLGQAIGGYPVICSDIELVSITPPSGQTCGSFLDPYISTSGGYLVDATATSNCSYCPVATTDDFLGNSFNIYASQHQRNAGIFLAFSVFNVFAIYAFTYFFQIRQGSIFTMFKRKKKTA